MPDNDMHLNSEYKSYAELRSACNGASYRNIAVDMLCAYFLADFIYNYRKKSIYKKIKRLVKCLMVPNIKYPQASGGDLYGWSIDRSDYKVLASGYQKKLGGDFDSICLSGNIVGWVFFFSFSAFFNAAKIAFTANKSGVKKRLFLFSACFQSMNFLEFLRQRFKNPNTSRYLSFNSSYDYESVFTLYLRSKGIPTFTMQHGVYYQFKGKIPFEMIGMYFSTAETFLAWGDFTVNEINHYLAPATEMVVFGHPVYSARTVKKCHSPSSRNILILLPRVTYTEEIFSFLDILIDERFRQYEFTLRLHPSLAVSEVEHKLISCQNFKISTAALFDYEFEKDFLCVAGFNSTTLFESIYYGLPILQFISGNDEYRNVGFLEFADCQGLSAHILSSSRSIFPALDPKEFFG
ncbi:MAG: hypothetical protein KJ930_08100 [Gammaproteobacteria bacterium]|nr:hypothetical protein [Gammaproteobacteria bacterium]MBU2064341.1 hypothetical protein [Gammaproteobacteria bacterium]MBU2179383.1 hypothetical protein [Gammaproteobacteria bacterium]MBU2255561.1 hypothetical protein [Gammaproteobacteria bacterium]